MTDEQAVIRRCADETGRLIAELDRAGLGRTPAALHMTLAADDLERRSGGTPRDAVYLVEGDDDADDPAWGFSPLVTGSVEEIVLWLRGRSDLERLSVVTGANEVLWARDYLERPPDDTQSLHRAPQAAGRRLTPDQERWAEALAVERMHGDGAEAHVVARITELTLAGDEAGCARWRAIGERLERLRRG